MGRSVRLGNKVRVDFVGGILFNLGSLRQHYNIPNGALNLQCWNLFATGQNKKLINPSHEFNYWKSDAALAWRCPQYPDIPGAVTYMGHSPTIKNCNDDFSRRVKNRFTSFRFYGFKDNTLRVYMQCIIFTTAFPSNPSAVTHSVISSNWDLE